MEDKGLIYNFDNKNHPFINYGELIEEEKYFKSYIDFRKQINLQNLNEIIHIIKIDKVIFGNLI